MTCPFFEKDNLDSAFLLTPWDNHFQKTISNNYFFVASSEKCVHEAEAKRMVPAEEMIHSNNCA